MVKSIHTAVKGRARYKVKQLAYSPSFARYLEDSLVNQQEIISVTANAVSGNVLIYFQPEISYQTIAAIIDQKVLHYSNKYRLCPKKKDYKPPVVNHESAPRYNWHQMPVENVIGILGTCKTSGLSEEFAAINLNKYGYNVLPTIPARSPWDILINQFKSLPVVLLGVAAGISIVTGKVIDAGVILSVVGINAIIGYVTETQSEKIIHSIKQRETTLSWVIRDSQNQEISTESVVLGDILLLRPGIYVGADARIIVANNLTVDESTLTGESIPIKKTAASLTGEDVPLGERRNMVYRGTLVTSGTGMGVVVAIGQLTEIGQIQELINQSITTETPLEKQLRDVGSKLVVAGVGICSLVFGVGILRGNDILSMIQSCISLAVAAVPEGLPTIATTTLALGIRDMRQNKVLIRSLSAVEALGSVQTICLDKTGTITENQMSVVEIHTNTKRILLENQNNYNINLYGNDELLKLIHVAVLCNESEVSPKNNGEYLVTGSPTENALIHLAISAGVNVIDLRQQYQLQKTNLRSENRNLMSTIHQTSDRHHLIAAKGNPAELIEKCQWGMKQGQLLPLTPADKQNIKAANDSMAAKALRVLGIAYNYVQDANHNHNHESDLTWLGLVGMADPIRQGAKQLIRDFHQAGIDTIMITGDQSPTARAIAQELKLSRDSELEILDFTHLQNLTQEDLTATCDRVNVFARISPSNKLQIVQALQGTGKVVAMTGDGVNDAPALKAAQVGIAMGKGGTDVAREVADIVLEDDNLETMMIAISRGRTIYNNIRKSLHFLLATNLSEIIVMTIATAAGWGEPLNPMQLLWLNLVTDIFPGLALAMEPTEPDILSQPPRNSQEAIIKDSDFSRLLFESVILSISTLGAYGYGILKYGMGYKAGTVACMTLISGQLLHTISCRSEKHSIFSSVKLPNNYYLNGAITLSFAIQLLALGLPPLSNILKTTPVSQIDGAVIGGAALLPLLVNEVTKNSQ